MWGGYMSVIPCFACPTSWYPVQVDRTTLLQLRARPCDTVNSGANVAWILHWAELRFFPPECRPLRVKDVVSAQVLGTTLEGTVTKMSAHAIELTLVNTFLVNMLGTSLVVTLHVISGHICSATSSATGCDFRYNVFRPGPDPCQPLPPLLDVQWQQTGTVDEHLYPMVQEGAGEHRMLNGVDTYYITQGEETDTLVLYNVATGTEDADSDNALTMLPLDEVDQAGWLEFYDAATGELLAKQNAAFTHDSNKVPISASDYAQLFAYDMETALPGLPARQAVKLKVTQTTTVPVGYFVFGNGRRLNIELGDSLLEADPGLAFFIYFNQLRHARFSAGTGTLVQNRRMHYKFTHSFGGLEVDKHVFAVVLGGIPFVLSLKSDLGVAVSHTTSGDFALTLSNPFPNFQTGDAVRLDGILGTLSPVSPGPVLDSSTTYYIKRTGKLLIQLFRDADLQMQVQFTDTTASGMPFFLMHEHVAATHGQHGGEMVVLEDHPEDWFTTLPTLDLVPGTFNAKSGNYFQVFGDNPSIVVGSKT